MNKKVYYRVIVLAVSLSCLIWGTSRALASGYVSFVGQEGSFLLSQEGQSTPIFAGSQDYAGVLRAMYDLKSDIGKVTGTEPLVVMDGIPQGNAVIIGTLGKNPIINRLVKEDKLDVREITGKWETFLIQVVENPAPGIEKALVIVGSDKRGTIFGIYDVSLNIGVSPWHFWADVPIKRQNSLYILPGKHTLGEPKVKYRGIFINDEAPALTGWVFKTFGGFNHQFYEHVFELILRMKGNFLWPAMWGREFYVEDPLNPKMADEYGVVIGTSHHEPMMRAHAEWSRYGQGPWNYEKNEEVLRDYWAESIKRMGDYESLVTVGMRGDGDEPMTQGTAIELLERIINDQRKIIEEVTGKPAEKTHQVWALYKEVQDYFDKGMRVPDDVTLLLCDDNWGNIRKLPQRGEKPRKGGYGVYYHYDYVGGPRNYKWINTNPIGRVWEQMNLAYRYGAREIWIVNVGDIKPMEFPIEFFLDFAWNPERWPAERLPEYHKLWAERQFGSQHAHAIGSFLNRYTKYNGRRKPELLSPTTYSLINYREAERVIEEWNMLVREAKIIYDIIPEEYRAAYYQLVMYPVEACATVNELYVAAAKNRLYANQGRASTNDYAELVKTMFDKDAEMTRYYNEVNADGKWSHMMDQTRIGYTSWQEPKVNVMPEVRKLELPTRGQMGVAIEGSNQWWPNSETKAILPEFDAFNRQSHFIEIFNTGRSPINYSIKTGAKWIRVSSSRGRIAKEQRVSVSINWDKAPVGKHVAPIAITGPDQTQVIVEVPIHNPKSLSLSEINGFVQSNGYVSMEAENYKRAISSGGYSWKVIPDLGRTVSGVTAFPVMAEPVVPSGDSPRLEYDMHLFDSGEVKVLIYLSPTLNFHDNQGLRFAVSFGDEEPQIVNMHSDKSNRTWDRWVSNNIVVLETKHHIKSPGIHTLKFWLVDPAVVLQKIVVDMGGVKPSYLGPPQSFLMINQSK